MSVCGTIKELEELVQQDLLKHRVFFPVNILPMGLGVVIGKGGSHAAKVQEELGVRLCTKSHEYPESQLVVEGPLSAAEKSVASIELHVAERRRRNKEHPERNLGGHSPSLSTSAGSVRPSARADSESVTSPRGTG